MKLHEDFPTTPLLMKFYMDLNSIFVIPQMIEEVLEFKAFIKPYLWSEAHHLIGHTKAQQFWLYMRNANVAAMQYKLLCMTQDWNPPESFLFGMLTRRIRRCYQLGSPNFAIQYS